MIRHYFPTSATHDFLADRFEEGPRVGMGPELGEDGVERTRVQIPLIVSAETPLAPPTAPIDHGGRNHLMKDKKFIKIRQIQK